MLQNVNALCIGITFMANGKVGPAPISPVQELPTWAGCGLAGTLTWSVNTDEAKNVSRRRRLINKKPWAANETGKVAFAAGERWEWDKSTFLFSFSHFIRSISQTCAASKCGASRGIRNVFGKYIVTRWPADDRPPLSTKARLCLFRAQGDAEVMARARGC